MAIRGLTDTVLPTFPRIGKLRKGGPRPESGRRPGKDLEYFRFTSDRPDVVNAFQAVYGDEPQEIDVYLPYARIEDNFSCWKEHWQAGGLLHRCDGETCTIWLREDGSYSQEPKPCPGGCKEVGRLSLILPPLIRAGYVGYVTMETHSLHDILAIQAALMATVEARGQEDLRGIGFCLRRVAENISTPSTGGKRVRRIKWLVKLEPAAAWVAAQLDKSRSEMLSLPSSSEGRALPTPTTETDTATEEEPQDQEEPQDAESKIPEERMNDSPEHWTSDSSKRARFWARWKNLGLERADAHREFGVESMKDTTMSWEGVSAILDLLDYGLNTLTLSLLEILEAWGIETLAGLRGTQLGPKMRREQLDKYVAQKAAQAES